MPLFIILKPHNLPANFPNTTLQFKPKKLRPLDLRDKEFKALFGSQWQKRKEDDEFPSVSPSDLWWNVLGKKI